MYLEPNPFSLSQPWQSTAFHSCTWHATFNMHMLLKSLLFLQPQEREDPGAKVSSHQGLAVGMTAPAWMSAKDFHLRKQSCCLTPHA